MSKHHHHHRHSCPEEEEIIERILDRCCHDRRPILPERLSPEEIRKLRCLLDCLEKCLCRPIRNDDAVAGIEDLLGRRRDDCCRR